MAGIREILLVAAVLSILSASSSAADDSHEVGVNWGNIASHPLNPNYVVGMLKDNKINKVKMFDTDDWSMSALAGTGIEVMVGIPNDQLERLAKDYGEAKDWVKENVTRFMHNGGVNIKYVAVGNEPFLSSYNNSFIPTTFPAFKNIHKALQDAGLKGKVTATIPQNAEVYESHNDKPSAGEFRKDIKPLMKEIVQFFHKNGNPFTVNIYPFLSLYLNDKFPMGYAFFDPNGEKKWDEGKTYTNVFDANYDTLVWALKKAGVSNLKIIVGEVGWPTDGHKFANASMAEKFYNGMMKKLGKNEGTPLRPGKLDVYLFGLLDENMKSILPGPFERHWGIFRYDGQPKFPIDFTGQNRKIMPIGAKGVQYMDRQWCVANKEVAVGTEKTGSSVAYACYNSDCSSMVAGGSCNKLDSVGNMSYAFNSYFQMQSQDVRACDFDGAAMIVKHNASTGNCVFPIQIVSHGSRRTLVSAFPVFLLGVSLTYFLAHGLV